MNFGLWFKRYMSRQTYRQAYICTDRCTWLPYQGMSTTMQCRDVWQRTKYIFKLLYIASEVDDFKAGYMCVLYTVSGKKWDQ